MVANSNSFKRPIQLTSLGPCDFGSILDTSLSHLLCSCYFDIRYHKKKYHIVWFQNLIELRNMIFCDYPSGISFNFSGKFTVHVILSTKYCCETLREDKFVKQPLFSIKISITYWSQIFHQCSCLKAGILIINNYYYY